ncbi:mitochondrial potassium channel ATP-binding subunit [Culicoides brevitarsis]|uniref:mitochondrial potassium channel ATP-binding subunit n=1 Tax=Culicoides brevitarsis TaxID=469753 RepID=UPI00307C7EAD
MLQILLAGATNICRKQTPHCINKLQFVASVRQNLLRQAKREFTKISTPVKPETGNVFKLSRFLVLGGTGISLALHLRNQNLVVECQASRLKGLRQSQKDIKFDWRLFWTYLKPHLAKFLAAIVTALVVAYLNIQIPTLLGGLVNALSKYAKNAAEFDRGQFLQDMKPHAINLFTCYIGQSIFTFMYILLLSQIGEQMATKIRQDLFRQIIVQDLAFFDENRTGELVNRLTTDVQEFKHSFKQCVAQGLRSIAQLIGGGISLFLISPHLATVALVSVPAGVLIGSIFGASLRILSKRSQIQSEKATAVCEEALSNIRTVRASACEMTEVELFSRETEQAAILSQQLGTGIAAFQAMTNLFLNGMVLGTLSIGGYLMSNDSISPGQLMAFLVGSQIVQRSLAQGSILFGTVIKGLTAGSRVFEFLSVEPKVKLNEGIRLKNDSVQGEIVFENVSFVYPSRPEQTILKDFNLVLKPGQTIALVGHSGCGKSTIAGLLERFYEPTSGRILIDGVDLREICPDWLRGELIGLIEQQPILFGTTILENIRYGRPHATLEEIQDVAKDSQCHEFITKLPEGYDTMVGERGIQLSGGQRQRIAIARALLKLPKILILDEATSALDANSEAEVQKTLDIAATHRTSLIIAHRLSTIKNADVIVVLDSGKIVEMGTHDALMRQRGHYFDLVKQQERQKGERAQG